MRSSLVAVLLAALSLAGCAGPADSPAALIAPAAPSAVGGNTAASLSTAEVPFHSSAAWDKVEGTDVSLCTVPPPEGKVYLMRNRLTGTAVSTHLGSLGRLEEAARVVEDGGRQGLTVFWADCILGMARARQGRRDEALAVLERMIEKRQTLNVSCASIAWVAACLGDFDAAFEWFDRGYAGRDGLLPSVHVYTNVFVPALRRDPRYRALLERMRLTDVA